MTEPISKHAPADLARELEAMRARLLDLTKRNPLLNYRHPVGTSIRVIDEVPHQLFARLAVQGLSMQLEAVVDRRQVRARRDAVERAIDAAAQAEAGAAADPLTRPADAAPQGVFARSEDGRAGVNPFEDLLLGLEGDASSPTGAYGTTPPAPRPAAAPTEPFSDAQAVLLNAAPDAPRLGRGRSGAALYDREMAARARALGINPAYELPATDASDTKRHTDTRIQTLLDPLVLEQRARHILREATTYISETGANRLHLCFGFVEWRDEEFDPANPTGARVAPLVLLPVRLQRGALETETNTFRYSLVRYSEDWGVNLTLVEKCRRDFGFILPDTAADEENLEAYFARVEQVLREQAPPGWRLRRWVSLGFVSFAKILMWRDLNPASWPAERPLLAAPALRRLLGDGDTAPGAELGITPRITEYALDDLPPHLGPLPACVVDVDGSQHSTMIDVQQGECLVIQGPPGTGKSQTITNIIANSLLRGQRVLFVAEKFAALDVVHRRLTDAGLGPFCLSLHSHTADKRAFLAELSERLSLRGTTEEPARFGEVEDLLERARLELSGHVARLHAPFGALGWTPEALCWRTRALLMALGPEVSTALRDLRVAGAVLITPPELGRHRDTLTAFVTAIGVVQETAPVLGDHPWAGVTSDNLTPEAAERLIDHGHALVRALDATTAARDALAMATELPMPDTLGALAGLLGGVATVRPPAPAMPDDLPDQVLTANAEPAVRAAVEAVDAAQAEWAQVEGRWRAADALTPAEAAAFDAHVTAARTRLGADTPADHIATTGTTAATTAQTVEEITRLLGEVCATLGLDVPQTPAMAARVIGAVAALQDASVDDASLALRAQAALADADASERLAALAERARRLRATDADLAQRLAPSLRPNRATLKAHVTVLATAPGFLPWLFSGPYRAASAAHRAMRGGVKAPRAERLSETQALFTHLEAVDTFAADPAQAALFGSRAAGLESPYARAEALLGWLTTVRQSVHGTGEAGRALLDAAWTRPASAWRDAIARVTARPAVAAVVPSLAGDLAGLAPAVGADAVEWQAMELSTLRALLTTIRDEAQALTAVVSHAGAPTDTTPRQMAARLAAVMTAWAADAALAPHSATLAAVGVPGVAADRAVHGPTTDVGAVAAALDYLTHLRAATLPPALIRWLAGPSARERFATLSTQAAALETAVRTATAAADTLVDVATLDAATWAGTSTVSAAPINALRARMIRALGAGGTLTGWATYRRTRAAAVALGHEGLLRLVETQAMQPRQLGDAFEAVLCRTLADAAFRAEPGLDRFAGALHNATRGRFADLDAELVQLTRAYLRHALNQAPPVAGLQSRVAGERTDEAFIQAELAKTRAHAPIRELFRRAGHAVQALKPCVMMSPQAVAQYLTPGQFEFDLVVMDEASQMRPEEALGAVARGRQVVVVGDPKQLGPSNFFASRGDGVALTDDEEELSAEDDAEDAEGEAAPVAPPAPPAPRGATVLEGAESILAAAASRWPMRRLRWHYRSRHPQLIAFSNRHFYDGDLVVFPTPGDTDADDGVFYHAVADARFVTGRNEAEAAAVVRAVQHHAATRPERTLLVATMNLEQKTLIADLLDEAEKTDAVLAAFRERHAEGVEPLVVKNLETLQGDEREVVLISVTYAPRADGRMTFNFGPINQVGGERRLNVLVTRAKHRVDVFCSFDPTTIPVRPTSSAGLRAFAGYLQYAQAAGATAGPRTGEAPATDRDRAVIGALAAEGLVAHPRVGIAGTVLDYAIVDPEDASRYCCAVEFDGPTYARATAARDRDRLRQRALEGLGWTVLRGWTPDWFRDPHGQAASVASRVRAIARQKRGVLMGEA